MKGINEGYSGPMNRLRICVGLIATALLVGALPAQAGTTFRTAKVCAQTQSGVKITGVKFTWIFPGTVGGSGVTNNLGCFTAKYLPVGDVTFRNGLFTRPIPGSQIQVEWYRSVSTVVAVQAAGNVIINLKNFGPTMSIDIRAEDRLKRPIPSEFTFAAVSVDGLCSSDAFTYQPFSGFTGAREFTGFFSNGDNNQLLTNALLVLPNDKLNRWNFEFSEASFYDSGLTMQITSTDQFMGVLQSVYDTNISLGFSSSGYTDLKVFRTQVDKDLVGIQMKGCIRAEAKSGTQTLDAYAELATPTTTLTYSEYLQGFTNVPKTLKAKSGKATFSTTLHDNQNKPMSGTPVTVSEPKASNPNIGKKVGSCKPVLTATTNAQGKATFTLCPTKNTTVTVKAPPLGIVSQSITVTK